MNGALRRIGILLATLGAIVGAGCHNMEHQSRYDPLEPSAFFADGRSARMPVVGTVPRGASATDSTARSGRDASGQVLTRLPVPVTPELLRTGQERYDIYCAPCHSRTGDGTGMIARRGYRQPPSFFEPRLMAKPPGYLFDVMTHGFGAMPPYDYLLDVDERWAVASYIRALQLLRPRTAGPAAELAR